FTYIETAPASPASPSVGPITLPMVFAPNVPLLGIAGDGAIVPVSIGSANIANVPVPGRFALFLDSGTPVSDGTSLSTIPSEVWKAVPNELPTSSDFWGFGKLYGVGKAGDATAGGQTKSGAINAFPENGRTILSWVLKVADTGVLQLGWSAGLADGG